MKHDSSIYVAGGSAEIEVAEFWIDKLETIGFNITHDWTKAIRSAGVGANPKNASFGDKRAWVMQDLNGVAAADIFWMLIPHKPTVGAWVELGYAHHTRTADIIVSGLNDSIFTAIADERFNTHDAAFVHITHNYGYKG